MRSTKILVRANGTRIVLPSKCDQIKVEPGDQLIYQTAGGGGWGDPLQRAAEKVRIEVVRELVSLEKARHDYGVVIDPRTMQGDEAATRALRERMAKERGPIKTFDFGPPLHELLARCKEETGLEPPVPPKLPANWATNGVKQEAA
jgi:N-methylhydantoinase B